MDSGKHAGSFSFACEKVIAAPQEQMGGDARGGWRGAVGRLWIFRFYRWLYWLQIVISLQTSFKNDLWPRLQRRLRFKGVARWF